MNMVQKIEHWGDIHHTKSLDVVRIGLGLLILSKGIAFVSDTGAQQEWIIQHNTLGFSGLMAVVVLHTVAFAHLVGGLLILIGLVTRFAAVIQIPILLGAIFFVNISKGFSFLNSELWLSIIVLLLLVLFWVVGSGPFSVDNYMKTHRPKP
ncbi:putative membrane protein YphA (DoxX/SURF4 family) [Pedobacter cryoconitis]|uniref:Putative membrane protein YphA (DoxX/SURF4 family) n=1 Tax=Pedobacter cryoconitis TaxID=188932 RepID=A0A7W8ZRH5_9SPHI|nr:DoxX family protein [Pedobacter cryoconitis]MBB5638861.1 putative membrane protein YphA (DoxX/SURF4 family) [Pedobacter cryoconitis]